MRGGVVCEDLHGSSVVSSQALSNDDGFVRSVNAEVRKVADGVANMPVIPGHPGEWPGIEEVCCLADE